MSELLPIYYDGFWDVPAAFSVEFEGNLFLFWRGYFDEELDDYPPDYKVYAVKNTSLKDAFEPRKETRAIKLRDVPLLLENEIIGAVSIKEVDFDHSKRRFIDSRIFNKLLTK